MGVVGDRDKGLFLTKKCRRQERLMVYLEEVEDVAISKLYGSEGKNH